MTLAERRARFVYEAARIENSASNRPINPEPWEERDEEFRRRMIEAVERQISSPKGPAELHEDWVAAYKQMGWVYGPERNTALKHHPDMVPYDDLNIKEQEKDWVFVKLCEIAARIT